MYIIFAIYFFIVFFFFGYILLLYSRDRNSFMKVACKRLLTTIQCMGDEIKDLDKEIQKLYIGYSSNVPSVKKVYPNVVTWLEDILYRINGDFRYARKLKPYIKEIKQARDLLLDKYPFYQCEDYQQQILYDLREIESIDEQTSRGILFENLISKLKTEFLRLNMEIGKNSLRNTISVWVTIISIVVTIFSIIS